MADRNLDRAGERIWTLVRLLDAREGFDRADDTLPPALEGPDGVSRARFDGLLDARDEETPLSSASRTESRDRPPSRSGWDAGPNVTTIHVPRQPLPI